jgi:uncharacterized OB-fold protein
VVRYRRVSGRGQVQLHRGSHGARHSAFIERSPYLVGLVGLAEQPGLLLYTNFPGASLADLSTGAQVEVTFEPIADDVVLPQFALLAP